MSLTLMLPQPVTSPAPPGGTIPSIMDDSESLSETFQGFVLVESAGTPEQPSEKASIHGLPEELVISVFSEVVRDYISTNIEPSLNSFPRAPFLVAAVCSAWRDIMLCSPALWTNIIIHLDAPSWPKDYNQCLDHFLKRSGSALLDVSITCMWRDRYTDHHLRRVRRLLARVISFGHRIQALAIRSNFDLLWNFGYFVMFPNLTHLHFFEPGTLAIPRSSVPVFKWISPRNLPSLTKVRVEDGMDAGFMQGARGMSSQVKTWCFTTFKLSDVLDVLEASADTIQVFATAFGHPGDLSSPGLLPQTPTLTQLRELYIDASLSQSDDPLPVFFKALTSAPCLQTLFIEDYDNFPDPTRTWDADAFKGFAERSNLARTLTRLSIRSTFITDENAIQMLNMVPQLRFLIVDSFDETGGCVSTSSIRLIEYLSPTKDSDRLHPVLPYLQVLRLSIRGSRDIPQRISALAQLAELRSLPQTSTQKLESLLIWADDSLPKRAESDPFLHTSLNRLLRCRLLGLTINVRYENDHQS